jgi:hypothetical protein
MLVVVLLHPGPDKLEFILEHRVQHAYLVCFNRYPRDRSYRSLAQVCLVPEVRKERYDFRYLGRHGVIYQLYD